MTTSLGHKVKIKLRERGLRQKDLADAIGLTEAQVSRILSGLSSTTPQTIVQMARYLREPETEYIRLYGEIAPPPENDPILERIVNMYSSWSDEDRDLLLRMAEMITGRTGESKRNGKVERS